MSILKMEAVTIAGKINDFESVVTRYVIGRDVHLENSMVALGEHEQLYPFDSDNQYAIIVRNILSILQSVQFQPEDTVIGQDISKEDMINMIYKITSEIDQIKENILELENKIVENELILQQLKTMPTLDVDLNKILQLEFFTFRFGRIPRNGYGTLTTYLEELDAVFVPTLEAEQDVWGFYFMPTAFKQRVDAVFSSLYFEQISIPDGMIGTPKQSYDMIVAENNKIRQEIKLLNDNIKKIIADNHIKLSTMYHFAHTSAQFCEVRKHTAHSGDFFYVVGWMPQKEAQQLVQEAESDESVLVVIEKPEEIETIKAPTKLKNFRLFKPFEFFVRMYGLPSYNEIDPTPILAITYILLFGIMFGDVGQSAIFAIAGFIIYKKKKIDLAAIVSMVGVSGVFFGFIYGSVFGNETLLEHIRLIEPMEKITFMLLSAVALGVILIVFCMCVNMVNAFKKKEWGKLIFGHNGLSGLIFYGALLIIIGSAFLSGGVQIGIEVVIATILIPCILMFMQQPLSKLVAKKKNWLPKEGIFYVESFFELFEVLLSFVTNTISFLRVGAFAIIHVGMMMVIGVLAQKAGNGGNIVVVIIGNIVVMGLEGLIVGIQVLRLEYYEMFSRYFEGEGKEFSNFSE